VSFTIQFFTEGVSFTLKDRVSLRRWLNTVIRREGKSPWYINFIFCNDDYLLELNKTYLNHSTLTDILSFSYNDDPGTVSGDIFISLDRVRENAAEYQQEFDRELKRVMVHGILHLIGYSDKGKNEKEKMTEKEDFYLNLF
jgi:probable rRNA maturation factor